MLTRIPLPFPHNLSHHQQAIIDAGGWESDTVVEDMDLSLRCYLNGWTALYLNHVDSPNELPCTLSSYKTQQFR